MAQNIPLHTLPKSPDTIPAFRIYRFKNSQGIHQESPVALPITPLPTDTPHRHSYYEMLFIEEGEGFHEIDFHSYSIQGTGLHFLTPGQVHLLNASIPCKGYILAFSEDFYTFYNPGNVSIAQLPFFQPTRRQPIIHLTEAERDYFHNLMANMVTEHLATHPDQSLIGRYLGLVLQKCGSIVMQRPNTAQAGSKITPELVGKFQELVEKNFLQWHEVQRYALELSVTPDYLSKLVKKFLGISAQEYILEKLLLEAKRLLVFTRLSSKEIAYHIQMDDPSYFSRIFKKKSGLTPNEYRELVRKSTI
ncbi:AraC-like DNA-binding protein [Dyadobacter jejuensis]|uniref:AraC-like DNA-binding protein n=1 Tax=Dyadobacter jejuensis TaxID=1082580 RepID=A0A316ABY8_9BACT|nr:helix-turn-helix domain-containing protein [Dyadobacter jejuensis]PWJ54550.1 AraC-like DNA-binding protein [Dyadobacter jejuensis]